MSVYTLALAVFLITVGLVFTFNLGEVARLIAGIAALIAGVALILEGAGTRVR